MGVASAGAALTMTLASTWGDGVTSTSGVCAAAVLGAIDTPSVAALTGFFNGA